MESPAFIFAVVESPYASPNAVELARNIAYIRAAMNDCFINHGEIPFASHGLYTQPGVLNDNDPEQRKLGIGAGFKVAEALSFAASRSDSFGFKRTFYIDRGWSNGMVEGLEDTILSTQDYEKRSLGKEWSKENDQYWALTPTGELYDTSITRSKNVVEG